MLGITKLKKCPCCSVQVKIFGVAPTVKNGFTKDGNQRVLCNDCLMSRVLHRKF